MNKEEITPRALSRNQISSKIHNQASNLKLEKTKTLVKFI